MLSRIIQLESHIADLIAAGEVVERPASVVKELLENSIDAGAKIITVEISAGGMTFIRVTDNGSGIASDDAKTAFLRHATSKLRGADDLEAIGSLGFRGEALAAIAAVSHIQMLTRQQGASEGVSLTLEAGTVTNISPVGCPEGTTIIVRYLFFNTPARLKFMKSDRAEASAVASTVLRCALSRPDVSIRYLKDSQTIYHTPGDSRMDSCIYSLLGREFFGGLTPIKSVDEAVSVEGYASLPDAARGNRGYQFFFINGRSIRSLTLQTALERAYANTLPGGRFPACVLYITTRLGDVDVNVHPAKTEVKFASEKQIFDAVYYAALSQLGVRNEELGVRGRERDIQLGVRNEELGVRGRERDIQLGIRNEELGVRGRERDVQLGIRNEELGVRNVGAGRAPFAHEGGDPQGRGLSGAIFPQNDKFAEQIHEYHVNNIRVIGEVFQLYIVVEYGGSCWFIDKHAAHERIHFDALKSKQYEPMPQTLLTPVICRHSAEETAMFLDNSELFEKLGFSIEPFGEETIAVRQIPSNIEIGDTESILSEISDELKLGGGARAVQEDSIFSKLACKAAIKAGKSSEIRELEVLAARVMSGELTHCPHGRPVAFELTKNALDKSFKRL